MAHNVSVHANIFVKQAGTIITTLIVAKKTA